MNVTNHAGIRYCQRFLGIDDESKAKQHFMQNKEEIIKEIVSIKDNSEFIYSGSLNDCDECDYYLNDDVLIVCKSDAIITVLKVDYGFPEHINRQIVHELMKEIKKYRKKYERTVAKTKVILDKHDIEIKQIDAEIENLEFKIQNLKEKRKMIENTIALVTAEQDEILHDIKTLAYKLCYCVSFKTDLLSMRNGGIKNGNG